MQDSQTTPRMLTLMEAAGILRVGRNTMTRWLHSGSIASTRTTDGQRGQFRISETAIADFIARHEAASLTAACRCTSKGCRR